MFSTKLTRVANRATSSTASFSTQPSAAAAQRSSQCIASRPTHQRRPSSSKASCPPDSSKPAPAAKPAPTAKAAAATAQGEQSPAASAQPRRTKRAARLGRGLHTSLPQRVRGGSKDAVVADQWAALPAVPGLSHLTKRGTYTHAPSNTRVILMLMSMDDRP